MDPCTGQEIVRVSDCGAGEARTAVVAAYEAFQSWKQTTAKVRSSAGLHIYIKPPRVCAHTHGNHDIGSVAPAGEESAVEEMVRPAGAAPRRPGQTHHLRVCEYC